MIRFQHTMALLVGVRKVGRHLSQDAEIGRKRKCHALREYGILVGNTRGVHWAETRGVPNPNDSAVRHVDAGLDGYGYKLFAAQVSHNGGPIPRELAAVHLVCFVASMAYLLVRNLNLVCRRRIPCLWGQLVELQVASGSVNSHVERVGSEYVGRGMELPCCTCTRKYKPICMGLLAI